MADSRAGRYAQLDTLHEAQYGLAKAARGQLDALTKAGVALTEMKVGFDEILKQYPPFLQQSPERIKFLNQIEGLRKQIEALTFPSPDKTTANEIPVVPSLGFGKLDAAKISDAELVPFAQQVDATQAQVTQQRSTMLNELAGQIPGPVIDRAAQTAAEVRQQLSTMGNVPIGLPGKQIVALL